MKKTLLILGQEKDSHVRSVADYLHSYNDIDTIILDYTSEIELCIDFQESAVRVGDRIIFDDQNLIIWNRPKPNFKAITAAQQETPSEKYCRNEWQNFFRNLDLIFPSARSVNKNSSLYYQSHKGLQIVQAKSCGFLVPDTHFTNINPKTNDEYAIKPLLEKIYTDQGMAYTEIVSDEYLNKHKDQLIMCPMILQDYIPKLSELRVLATRNGALAVEILSQNNIHNTVDFRVAEKLNEYKKYNLDSKAKDSLFAYLNIADLEYGIFDFIINKNRDLIFLECNPDGQWLGYARRSEQKNEFVKLFADIFLKH